MVRIITPEQRNTADNSWADRFHEIDTQEFFTEIENGLGRKIDIQYDIQRIHSGFPLGLYYFAEPDGYLAWVSCLTCGATEISTLLMDGSSASVNIASQGMKKNVHKALLRDEMLNHPIFKKWINRGLQKPDYIRPLQNKIVEEVRNLYIESSSN